MAENNSKKKYAYLDQLSTKELLEILRADIDSPVSGDDEAILYILEVIEKREQEHPSIGVPDFDKSWDDFQKLYNTPEGVDLSLYQDEDDLPKAEKKIAPGRRGHRTVGRVLVMAAILACLIGMLAIPVAGHRTVFKMIGHWSAEQFSFNKTAIEEASDNDRGDRTVIGSDLGETLLQYNIQDDIIPKWMPDDFALQGEVEVQEYERTGEVKVAAFYSNETDHLIFSIDHQVDQTSGILYEKNSDSMEEYLSGGVVHYIFQNEENSTAAWYTDTLECSMTTTLSNSDLKKIIDSIYEE